jgi:beta-aspartyl-dipeptidase (metallo-type)
MSRNPALIEDGIKWIQDGGFLDFTARSSATVKALTRYFASGVNLERVTVSSDAGGSCPSFDKQGNLISYCRIEPDSMLWLLRKLHLELQWPLERALPLFTTNTADLLKFADKGRIAVGKDADLLLLSPSDLSLAYVFAQGQMMMGPLFLAKGMFEGPSV